jgi:hypothetical protein
MRLRSALLGLLSAAALLADTVTLRGGRIVNGTYLGGTSREIRMEVGEKIETFQVSDIVSIQFQGVSAASQAAQPAAVVAGQPSVSAPAPQAKQSGGLPRRDSGNVFRPDASTPAPAASRTSRGELPAGTVLTVRMIDAVDSQVNQVGEEFRASLDEPLMINGETVLPRGANLVTKLVDDKESGKLSGRAELTLDVVSIEVDGRRVDVNTAEVTTQSESRTASTGRNVGGGAALGAIIGAIAGGGRGAAIGAAAGGGAGAAVQVLTKGQRVRIPSETRLNFTLQNAVKL